MGISSKRPTVVARRSLDAFFSDSVREYPDRLALFVCGRAWSYLELDVECSSIEEALRMCGIGGKRANVGLIYAKSVFSYAAVVATMRNESVYVPLNPKQPAERLLRIIADAGIEALLVDTSEDLSEGVVDLLRQSASLQIIASDDGKSRCSLESVLEGAPQHRLRSVEKFPVAVERSFSSSDGSRAPDSARRAYIIYTSGSTGVPKGVAITHESACRCIEKLHTVFETNERDRFTQFSALSFDVSIADMFWCWKSGGTLYVPEHSEELVPLRFAADHAITVWSSVPSIANFLLKLRLLTPDALPSVRLSLFAGEALPSELAHAWSIAAPQSRVFNVYGPTECTIFSVYYEYQRQNSPRTGIVPIGLPLPGLRYQIVDDGRVVEGEDIPGELWLAGDQLALGYWNNPTATQRAFVQSPPNDLASETWYRTGDLVSLRTESGLSFRGRLDRQVKLRGYRVELQEIESVLRDAAGCTLAAVVPLRNAGGICEKIVAYCDSLNADEVTLKARCLTRLPQYMIPERIFRLDVFPLNDHGKVDYKVLAARTENRAVESQTGNAACR